jgi:5-methylcytosine-specific restriction endonuclease McrA
MPSSAMRACNSPGCKALVKKGYCDQHRKVQDADREQLRLSPSQRGYDRAWQALRAIVLDEEPLCRFCKEQGHVTAASEVDHIDGDVWNRDRKNLRALCKPCHSTRTAKDQAFRPGPFYQRSFIRD